MEKLIKELMDLVADYEVQYKNMIYKAFLFAAKYHDGVYRDSGDTYVTHPLEVAISLAKMKEDADTICAGLLHDTIEDTNLTEEEITKEFNPEVASLVSGVTKISNTNFSSANEARIFNYRKLIMSLTKDVRIIIIKLYDRLHNMRTLEYKSEAKQKSIAYETIEIYVPLANYIGAYKLKNELEDISLKYLQPEDYNSIFAERKLLYEKEEKTLMEMLTKINNALMDNGIPNETKLGIRNIYSIYKRKGNARPLNSMPNIFSIKIAVDDILSCYTSVGVIHGLYFPINNRFIDLIAAPRHNTYRSLHTTIKSPSNLLVQAQIGDRNQRIIADYGLTAYWRLNPNDVRERMQNTMSKEFQFYGSIQEIDKKFNDNAAFLEKIKEELFSKYIRVYTNDGISYAIKKNTPIENFLSSLGIDKKDEPILINGALYKPGYNLQDEDQISFGIQFKRV